MKKKLIYLVIFILLVLAGTVIIYVNNVKPIAYIECNELSATEESIAYTYRIYKKEGKNLYTYDVLKTRTWLDKVISKEIVETGDLKNKEDFDTIERYIEQLNVRDMMFGTKEHIYYKNRELESINELSEVLF